MCSSASKQNVSGLWKGGLWNVRIGQHFPFYTLGVVRPPQMLLCVHSTPHSESRWSDSSQDCNDPDIADLSSVGVREFKPRGLANLQIPQLLCASTLIGCCG
jgi:hypothetical protein